MIFNYYPNDFWHKSKIDHFDPYAVLLSIATNIPMLLMTGFVVQGHISQKYLIKMSWLCLKIKKYRVIMTLKLHKSEECFAKRSLGLSWSD